MIYEIKANRTRIQNVRCFISLIRVTCVLRRSRFAEVIFVRNTPKVMTSRNDDDTTQS